MKAQYHKPNINANVNLIINFGTVRTAGSQRLHPQLVTQPGCFSAKEAAIPSLTSRVSELTLKVQPEKHSNWHLSTSTQQG